jgi:hypothetical protein
MFLKNKRRKATNCDKGNKERIEEKKKVVKMDLNGK